MQSIDTRQQGAVRHLLVWRKLTAVLMEKPQLAVRIPPTLLAKLNRYVEQTGTSKTDVVVSAIPQYIGCSDTVPLMQRLAELELRMKELTALVKSGSSLREVEK